MVYWFLIVVVFVLFGSWIILFVMFLCIVVVLLKYVAISARFWGQMS